MSGATGQFTLLMSPAGVGRAECFADAVAQATAASWDDAAESLTVTFHPSRDGGLDFGRPELTLFSCQGAQQFLAVVLGRGGVESHGAAVVGRQGSAVGVDSGRWDEPGMAVDADEDVPAVVVDVGVTARAQQAPVVQGCLTIVAPVQDVMGMGTPGRSTTLDAALIAQVEGFA